LLKQQGEGKVWDMRQGSSLVALVVVVPVVAEGMEQGTEKVVALGMDAVVAKGDVQLEAQIIHRQVFNMMDSIREYLPISWSGSSWHNATWLFILMKIKPPTS
jgi:hypothetical protein